MRRNEALRKLQSLHAFLSVRGVERLRVFGSVARDEATPQSDIDLIVDFSAERDLLDFVALQQDLSEVLGVRVDLASGRALRPELRDSILAEAIDVKAA